MVVRSLLLVGFVTMVTGQPLLSQDSIRTLVGRVTDAMTETPIAGGVVSVSAFDVRDVSRPDGVFVLHVPRGRLSVRFSADGYVSRVVEVPADQSSVFVALRRTAITLRGLITVGSRARTTMAPATVTGKAVRRVPAVSVTQGLQGKIAGADVRQNSGVPGGDLQLMLRGITSIGGATSPLFVVDGVYISNESVPTGTTLVTGGQEAAPTRIVDLNPNDVASIRVLKGSAAAALFGSKGSNGVVIITTKRGR